MTPRPHEIPGGGMPGIQPLEGINKRENLGVSDAKKPFAGEVLFANPISRRAFIRMLPPAVLGAAAACLPGQPTPERATATLPPTAIKPPEATAVPEQIENIILNIDFLTTQAEDLFQSAQQQATAVPATADPRAQIFTVSDMASYSNALSPLDQADEINPLAWNGAHSQNQEMKRKTALGVLRLAVGQGARFGQLAFSTGDVGYIGLDFKTRTLSENNLDFFRGIQRNLQVYDKSLYPKRVQTKLGAGGTLVGQVAVGQFTNAYVIAFEEDGPRYDGRNVQRFALVPQSDLQTIIANFKQPVTINGSELAYTDLNGQSRTITLKKVGGDLADVIAEDAGAVWMEQYPVGVNEFLPYKNPVVSHPPKELLQAASITWKDLVYSVPPDDELAFNPLGPLFHTIKAHNDEAGVHLIAKYDQENDEWFWSEQVAATEWANYTEVGKRGVVDPSKMFPLVGGIDHKNRFMLDLSMGSMKIASEQEQDLTEKTNHRTLRKQVAVQIENNIPLKKQMATVQANFAKLDEFQREKDFSNLTLLIGITGAITGAVFNLKGSLRRYSVDKDGDIKLLKKEEEPQLLPEIKVNGSYIERIDTGERIQFKGANILNFENDGGLLPTFADTKKYLDTAYYWGHNLVRMQMDVKIAAQNLDELEKVVDYAEQLGIYCAFSPSYVGRTRTFNIADQNIVNGVKDHMAQIALRFKNKNNILYGLINEPSFWDEQLQRQTITPKLWIKVANELAVSLRFINPNSVLVLGGINWDSEFRWLTEETFPFENYILDVHYYYVRDDKGMMPIPISQTEVGWRDFIGKKPILIGESGAIDQGTDTPVDLQLQNQQRIVDLTEENPYQIHYTAFAMWPEGQGGYFNIINPINKPPYSPSRFGKITYDNINDQSSKSPVYNFKN